MKTNNRMRELLCFFAAFALMAFGSFGIAATSPDKLFTINNPNATTTAPTPPPTPAAIAAGQTKTVTITVRNQSPKSGNSVINYLEITLNAPSTLAKLLGNANLKAQSGTAALCNGGATICVSGIVNGIKPSASFWVTADVQVQPTATCTSATWSAKAWTGNGGQPFVASPAGTDSAPAYLGCDGILACGQTVGDPNLDPNLSAPNLDTADPNSNTFGLSRIAASSDACTVAIPYSVQFGNQTSSTLVVKGNQNPLLVYVLLWQAVYVDSSSGATGWTQRRPNVAWRTDTNGVPLYVPGLACLSDDPTYSPTPMPIIPHEAPFTDPANAGTSYEANGTNRAKMCIAQLGWTPVGSDDPNDPTKTKVQYWLKVIDETDGFVHW